MSRGAFRFVLLMAAVLAVTLTRALSVGAHAAGQRSAAASTTRVASWTQFRRGPYHDGYNRFETALAPSVASRIVRLWSAPAGTGVGVSSPALSHGNVYIVIGSAAGSMLRAYDAATGAVRFTVPLGGQTESSPALWHGRVYVIVHGADQRGHLVVRDALSGAPVFTTPISDLGFENSPAIAGGVVYAYAFGGRISAVDALSGRVLWTASDGVSSSSPAVAGGRVFLLEAGSVVAWDAASGTLLSASQGLGCCGGGTSPAFWHGSVYAMTGRWLRAVDPATGDDRWRRELGNRAADRASEFSSPAIAKGFIYVMYLQGNQTRAEEIVEAHFAAGGARAWRTVLSSFVGGTSANFGSSPAVANGVVYVGSMDGSVHMLDARTGAELGRLQTGGPILSSPAVVNGRVFVGSDRMYAFGLP